MTPLSRHAATFPEVALAVDLLIAASAQRHGGLATGYEHHKGACKATLWALGLLAKQFPHALRVAVEVLHEDLHNGPARGSQLRVTDAAQIAEQLVANLRRGTEHLYDDVLPADFNGQEAVARADVAHRAALDRRHAADAARPAAAAQGGLAA